MEEEEEGNDATKRDARFDRRDAMLRARSTTTTATTTTTYTYTSFSSKRIPQKPLLLDGKRRRRKHPQKNIVALLATNAHLSPSLRSGTPLQPVGVKVVAKKATTTKSTLTDAVPRRGASVPALRATRDDGDDVPFGYTRLDVILIGGGVTGLGFAAYYGLQEFAGFDAQWAGNVVQLTFVLLLTLLWVGSYVQRVFNKDMTYGKQLKEYEEAVMQKRLEEMPESELMALMDESEKKER
jgi:hypothetical protein